MKVFRVRAKVTVSAWTLVRAESEEDALDDVQLRDVELSPLGPERDGCDPFDVFVVEAADGLPQKAEAEECPREEWAPFSDDADDEEG